MTSLADSFISITRSPLKPKHQCLVNISPSNLCFSSIHWRKAKRSCLKRRLIVAQARLCLLRSIIFCCLCPKTPNSKLDLSSALFTSQKLSSKVSSRSITSFSCSDDGKPSSSNFFVGGFVLGVVAGALGSVYVPKLIDSLAGAAAKKEVAGKRSIFIEEEETAIENTEENVGVTDSRERKKSVQPFWKKSLSFFMNKKRKFKLSFGSAYLPKINEEAEEEVEDEDEHLGEDAHFTCEETFTIGIADGVHGWAKLGIDSGVYARELMSNSLATILYSSSGVVDPEQVLREAYSITKAEGGSTACIITLEDECLHAVNVGDSGFILIREGKTVYKSPLQQKEFNCPYQLGNGKECYRPSSAEVFKVEVKKGDVIVAGTDGLFDNVFTTEIEETVSRGIRDGVEPQELATILTELAFDNSIDVFKMVPFRIAQAEAGFANRKGGKVDDITVIVAYVMPF